MQRAQSYDIFRHADLCSNPLIFNPGGQAPPVGFHAPKRRGDGLLGSVESRVGCRTATSAAASDDHRVPPPRAPVPPAGRGAPREGGRLDRAQPRLPVGPQCAAAGTAEHPGTGSGPPGGARLAPRALGGRAVAPGSSTGPAKAGAASTGRAACHRLGFFTDGETPGAVIARISPRWPALRFVLRPQPPD